LSRGVIQDIVIPIVSRIVREERYLHPLERFDIRDERLEEFLEEELRRRFGVIGANGCQHLREQLEEARKNDPYSFDFLVKELLKKYVKLATQIRSAERIKKTQEGPPDRFSELRKRYRLLNQHR